MLKPIVVAALSTVCNVSAAGDLNGIWQHPKDPVWLEVNEAMGTGIAVETMMTHRVWGLLYSRRL